MKQLLIKLDNVLAYMSVFSKYPLCLYALNLQMFLKRFQTDAEIPYGLSTNISDLQSWIDKNINSK